MPGKVFLCVTANLLAGRQMALIGSDVLPQRWVAGPGQALQNFLFHLGEVSENMMRQARFGPQHRLNHLSHHRGQMEDGGILKVRGSWGPDGKLSEEKSLSKSLHPPFETSGSCKSGM